MHRSCALHGIDNVDIKVGDTLAVIGAGPIGLMFVKLASLKGARVISVDLSDYRLEQAKKFGAFETVNAKDADHIDKVRKLSEEEKGVDAAIEATGFPEAWKNAVGMKLQAALKRAAQIVDKQGFEKAVRPFSEPCFYVPVEIAGKSCLTAT